MNHENGQPSRVYCAGPLFNQSERQEMMAIAARLRDAGYLAYVPHDDGMEFRTMQEVFVGRGFPAPRAAAVLQSAIFALDIYQLVVECNCLVWNLNGRTPDEGAVAEAAIAWTLGKPLVAYQDDVRSFIAGLGNPLLGGLVDFETVGDIESLPDVLAREMAREMARHPAPRSPREELPPRLHRSVQQGAALWQAMRDREVGSDDERLADVVIELFAARETSRI